MRVELAELFAVIMFFISFYGLIVTRNIIKSVIFIIIMEAAAIMFFLSIGYRSGILAPIGPNLAEVESWAYIADPFPQALMITAIVIGLSVTTILLIMTITITREYKTTDWDTIKIRSLEK
ncbi:MAG: cation:proton antiporter subunit C [Oscillospiraceae bacterium]|nr:cation:proton antiporter subunit C [Oscillospiraceae bacterium]